MTEPEVIISIALKYLKEKKVAADVCVSIDGAHIKTGNKIHFDIWNFMKKNACICISGDGEKWQGVYKLEGVEHNLRISSTPGVGDILIPLKGGKVYLCEAKKGKTNKSGQEYVLMREAIGQLMTNDNWNDNTVPFVAVPYSEKSYELATRWIEVPQLKMTGIGFMLVKEDGEIIVVN